MLLVILRSGALQPTEGQFLGPTLNVVVWPASYILMNHVLVLYVYFSFSMTNKISGPGSFLSMGILYGMWFHWCVNGFTCFIHIDDQKQCTRPTAGVALAKLEFSGSTIKWWPTNSGNSGPLRLKNGGISSFWTNSCSMCEHGLTRLTY